MKFAIRLYVYLVSCAVLAIHHADRRKNLFSKARTQVRIFDFMLRPVGRRGHYEVWFMGNRFKTPWLPMFRTQARAIFVDDSLGDNGWEREIHFAVDAGANIGVATIGMILRYHPRTLVSLEADPVIYDKYLKPNVEPFLRHSENVRLLNKALWITTGSIRFRATGLDDGQVIFNESPTDVHFDESIDQIKVECISLADLVKLPGATGRIDYMKLDIEGSELPVLCSIDENLRVEMVAFEVELTGAKVEPFAHLLSHLRGLGFLVAIEGHTTSSWRCVDSETAITSYLWVRAFR